MILENIVHKNILSNDILHNIKNNINIPNRIDIFKNLRNLNKNTSYHINYSLYNYQNYNFKNIQTKLYLYQQHNVKWMMDLENTIDNKNNFIKYHNKYIIKYKDLYIDTYNERFYLHKPPNDIFFYYGGILIDEKSLGKTLSLITLSLQNIERKIEKNNIIEYVYNSKSKKLLKTNSSLIICPHNLCNHWLNEIKKHVHPDIYQNLNIILINNKIQYQKITYQDILNADFVIISSNFLSTYKNFYKNYMGNNQDYKTIFKNISYELLNNSPLDLNRNDIFLYIFSWKRLIIDQLHIVNKNYDLINIFSSKYKWIITECSYLQQNYVKVINLLSNYSKCLSQNLINELTDKICRYNTYSSVQNEFNSKKQYDNVIWLNFSKSEKYIYNYYQNMYDEECLLSFCIYPHSDNLNKKCKTIYDIKDYLIKLNHKYIHNYEQHISIIRNDIDKFIDNENKLSILKDNFSNLTNKIKDCHCNIQYLQNIKLHNNYCPICLHQINESAIIYCGHIFCQSCMLNMENKNINKCPICRIKINEQNILYMINDNINIDEIGTKLKCLISYIKNHITDEMVIICKFDITSILNKNGINANLFKSKTKEKSNIMVLLEESNLSMIEINKIQQFIILNPKIKNVEWCNSINPKLKITRFLIKDSIEEIIYKKNINLY